MHKSSYRKFKIIKCGKKIRRESGSEKPGIINKIIKNIKNINRKGCGSLNKCVKRQSFKDPHGSKPAFMFRDISFTLLNLTLLNLILLGMSYSHVLNYGFYQI
jgi:hypothetical protein